MDFGNYIFFTTSKIEWAVQMSYMYQIVTRTGIVSWDSACLNAMANLIQLAKLPFQNEFWLFLVSRWICAVLPTIVLLLLLEYPPRTVYNIPYFLRWPVLLAGSAMLAWTVAEFSWICPWYLFVVYVDFFTSLPQGYIIVKLGGKTDKLTVGLFFLMFLLRTINGLCITVEGDEWIEPHVMSYWAHILIMCIPFVRFYVDWGRLQMYIDEIV